MEKYIRNIKLQRNTIWGCKMDSAGFASFWIRRRTCGFRKISNISDYLSDYQICKDSVPRNFSFNHVQPCEYLYLATICNFYSSPRPKPPVSLTPVLYIWYYFTLVSCTSPRQISANLPAHAHTFPFNVQIIFTIRHTNWLPGNNLPIWVIQLHTLHRGSNCSRQSLTPQIKILGPSMIRGQTETLEIWMTAPGSQVIWIPND